MTAAFAPVADPAGPWPELDARRLVILGATGSVGSSTLALVAERRRRVPGALPIEVLTAQSRVDSLIDLARAFRPALAVIGEPALYGRLKEGLAGSGVEAAAGPRALVEAAGRPADWVMAAIVGAAGLAPTLEAVRRGRIVAFANKECLVCAGPIFLAELARSHAALVPVDSEHNAIFQILAGARSEEVARLILTASGGPFRTASLAEMGAATPAMAIAHPNWDMGAKISVDSATMMNKGLELIEAHHLFGMGTECLDVVIHPQSIVHSLVEFTDGSVLAQLGTPDMRTPVAYALAWPHRMPTAASRLDLQAVATLSFAPPDHERFPALALARAALEEGQNGPTLLNAANEVAVEAFLARRIGFLDIVRTVERVLERISPRHPAPADSLEAVFALDSEARTAAREAMAEGSL
ncbi:MAG: 1-deoxy-D-xylulose-5-phosphate reductoisomerase [Alphaproteobacteria bacterium]|nr:1-deoxy-D-xylulose-5-phosphate reductoisomerase [Alphaproteobacteria bacterium]